MNRIATIIFLSFSTILNAQLFTVESYRDIDPFDYDCVFPVVFSSSHAEAADRINTYLQYEALDIIYGAEETSLFRKVFPPEGEIWGSTEFDYQVNTNTDKFFSVSITYAGTGAYSEYYVSTYNFVASTGEAIDLEDLFAETPLSDLGLIVNQAYYSEITDFMESIVQTDEDMSYQYEMYNECKEKFVESDWLPTNQFTVMDDGIRFERERCSNHAMRALDDIGKFSYELSFESLEVFMNGRFYDLMSELVWNPDDLNIQGKLLKGAIGGKYPITVIFNRPWGGDDIRGVYWYNKVKKPIELKGSFKAHGMIELVESIDGKEIAKIIGRVVDGVFSGKWIKSKDGTELSIEFGLN